MRASPTSATKGPAYAVDRKGKGFRYVSPDGGKVDDVSALKRIKSLADPARLDRRLDLHEARTAISRQPAATQGDASNTATTRAFAKSARARSTSTCWPSPRVCPPSARR